VARYIGPKAKLSRREGTDLFLKSARRSLADKCKLDSKPGQHGRTSGARTSDYGTQLREKQKVKRIYGVLERQFRRYFGEANRKKGRTGEEMISLLERRLDSVVHRLGFSVTRASARQLIRHNHVLVNGKRLNIPSYIVENGDKIAIDEASRKIPDLLAAIASADKRPIVSWIEADRANFAGTVKSVPVREELNEPAIREQYVVEYYSR
jgi:small subunit ribosomal protein S4